MIETFDAVRLFYNITDKLIERVKDLEERLKTNQTNQNLNGSDIQGLQMTKASTEYVLELQKRVKDLEHQNKSSYGPDWIPVLLELRKRIKDLEEWQRKHEDLKNYVGNDHEDRIIAIGKAVDKLEEWKDNHHRKWNGELENRIDKLEEWKRHMDTRIEDNYKVIDKKVWEDIRISVKNLAQIGYSGGFKISMDTLLEAIKKADPSFNNLESTGTYR